MAAKLKLNSILGGSISLKVDDTLTTDEEVLIPSDGAFGIESGSNANGSWTKFPDGTLIQSHILNVGTVEVLTAYGALFSSLSVNTENFPIPFIGDIPIVTILAFGSASAMTYQSNMPTLTAMSNAYLVRGTQTTLNDVKISWTAHGRWK